MIKYSAFSDTDLNDLLRSGDIRAFTEIYNRFFGLLYVHAYRKLGDEEEANDLIQELFTTLWIKHESLQITGNLSSYLYAAVRNRILNVIERRKVNTKYMDSLSSYTDHDYRYADHKIREDDLRSLIEKEVNALPEQMRQIFNMSRNEHLSYREIGVQLDMSEQAVKSQMKRALKTLRYKLGLFTFLMVFIKFF